MEPGFPGQRLQISDFRPASPEIPMATTGEIDWRAHAACISADPDLFFPISSGMASRRQERRAKAICAVCHVRAECLAFALESSQVHGVWGGLGEEELRRLRRSRRVLRASIA